MNKNIIILVVVAIVIGVGAALYLEAADDQDTTETTSLNDNGAVVAPEDDAAASQEAVEEAVEANHIVTFTDDGYTPSTVTINVGESVAFINNSSQTNWTASDPHPTHTDLPSFDAQRGVAPGEAYIYTFDEAGEWGYHDHQNSSLTGTVIVQ